MLSIEKLLFATDFSEYSKRAISHVAFWSARFNGEIHILHTTKRQKNTAEVAEKMAQLEKELTREYCRFSGPNSAEIRLVPVQVVGIDPAVEILKYAHAQKIDLIIQTTHGRSGFRRFFLGKVAEKVVSSARCSVLTVRHPKPIGPNHVHKILLPTDLASNDAAVLAHAVALGKTFGSSIHLLHVLEDASAVIRYRTGRKARLEQETTLLEEANQDLERLAQQADYAQITYEVKKGNVLNQIEKAVKEQETDLIMVPTKGYREGMGSPLGSIAQGVIYNIDAQIFTIHCQGKSLVANIANA